ncbi:RICIN domain-containing protein [Glycomyces arizonensis]|uniref:RICIN domain-containing protein n=1 Tax=Glycomyces arizonensis TaxID=256035 RepID=UPI00041E03EE|nr:RICIN domain-containing protein [Glycomyces arizonensis]
MSWLDRTGTRRTVLATGAGVLAASTVGLPATGAQAQQTFANPVIWQDFADVDVIRVGDTFYLSASTMHYSPGAPVLRSWDLVNWEFAGHSVPSLDFGSKYDLSGGRGYVRGIWASSLGYRPSEDRYYWIGQIDFANTYLYTAPAAEGPWSRHAVINRSYFDAGLLVDDDDTMYVAYGNTEIRVAQLNAGATAPVRDQAVFHTPNPPGVLEGSRFYKIGGDYYIFPTRPANGQYILKSTSGPWGPYEMRQVLLNLPGPLDGGGVPHQGGLVDTPNGDWYYMAFTDAYPGGRMPTLAPITWSWDGWPQLQTVNGEWGREYPFPNLTPREVEPLIGVDTFTGAALAPKWEWNHNPDNGRWSTGNGLRLQTATVTNDLYWARNTLTHRIQGPTSTATVELDVSGMADGDRAGLAMLRDSSAWIGVKREGGANRVAMVNNIEMDSSWNTVATGSEAAGTGLSGGTVWLRVEADIRPGSGRQALFSYSTDGSNFNRLGPGFTLKNAWQFFMGYRFAVFNHATRSLGGAVTVNRFEVSTQDGGSDSSYPETGVFYRLVAQHSGKAADIEGASTAAGAKLIQWSPNGGANQQFEFVDTGDGHWRVRARHSGLVLQVANNSTGADITQQPQSGSAAQQWSITDHGGGTVSLINRASGLAMDVWEASTDDGARISQWNYTGNTNQQFNLRQI